jgi:hypothetical protein
VTALLAVGQVTAQSNNDNLFSPNNRKIFGDYLFCNRDYLRAIDEYNAVLYNLSNDTLQYKIGLSYFFMGRYFDAERNYKKLFASSFFSEEAKLEYFRSLFYLGDYDNFRNEIFVKKNFPLTYSNELNRLKAYSYLMDDSALPPESEMLSRFDDTDRKKIIEFYSWKQNPPYKSPTKAAIMSAIIPGLGKVYAGEIGDGITAFLFTGLFTYLAIDKFEKDQNTSAWLFTALAAFFYGGNIYGSAAAVQNYNASIKFNFDNEVKLYLNKRNHFLPKPKYLCD